jgi:hypothetical protein
MSQPETEYIGRLALLYKEDAVGELLEVLWALIGVAARYYFNGEEIEILALDV